MKHYIQTVDMTDGGDRDQMKFWDLSLEDLHLK